MNFIKHQCEEWIVRLMDVIPQTLFQVSNGGMETLYSPALRYRILYIGCLRVYETVTEALVFLAVARNLI